MESYKVVAASCRIELLPETYGYEYRLKTRRLANEIIEKLDSDLVEYVKIEITEKLCEFVQDEYWKVH